YADPHVLALRVINNPVRPPFKPDQKPEKELKRLWEERRALYLKYADVVWDNTSGEVAENQLGFLFK
ncbi:MAG: shikimate kinase, partial [Candidatus Peregrinibacteria bacterium]